ncbi:MAG: hypothetical protein ABIP33_06350 [Pseudolysinimonas sp.]
MTTTPRTPNHWPRMQIRGARRRHLAAERFTTRTVLPYARMQTLDGDIASFVALADYEQGSFRLTITTVKDGFGRPVPSADRVRVAAA